MHVVIYLPSLFYSAMAAAIAEILQATEEVSERAVFSVEFVSPMPQAISKSGIAFPVRAEPTQPIDALILMAGSHMEPAQTLRLLEHDAANARKLIAQAQARHAIIASTCTAAYFLASAGLLNGKRATTSWWLAKALQERFPQVKWDVSRLIIREDTLYTCGAAFSAIELVSTLLIDLGYAEEEQLIRQLFVLPPVRTLQSPYEFVLSDRSDNPFLARLHNLTDARLADLTVASLGRLLGMSPRTLARMFTKYLQTSPGKWIQHERLTRAKFLLQRTNLSVAVICERVGYHDPSSFSRLFAKNTGASPRAFRSHLVVKQDFAEK